MTAIILFNKPFQVLSQFTSQDDKATLADYISEPGFYPAGRLDFDSEGLMLLTNSGPLQHLIASPKFKMPKTYWVQVEGHCSDKAIQQLQTGVTLKDGPTRPAQVKRLNEVSLWTREPPVRFRQNIPTSWLEIQITEGRNRQVRRMTAAVGYPTLRLVRVAIGPYHLDGMQSGQHRVADIEPALQKELNQYESTAREKKRRASTPDRRRRYSQSPGTVSDGPGKRQRGKSGYQSTGGARRKPRDSS